MGYFTVKAPDCVFRIRNDIEYDRSRYLSFGNPKTLIEMTLDYDTDMIVEIECLYLGEVFHEPAFKLPDRRSDPEMRTWYRACRACCYEDPTKARLPCMVNLTRDALTLIFSSDSNAKICVADGRVEYYYSREFDLVYIKVVDLTDEEYASMNR